MAVLLGCLSIFIVVSVHARFSIVDVPDAWMSGWGFVIHIIIFLVAIRGGTAIVWSTDQPKSQVSPDKLYPSKDYH